jgi:hypothetical protein
LVIECPRDESEARTEWKPGCSRRKSEEGSEEMEDGNGRREG